MCVINGNTDAPISSGWPRGMLGKKSLTAAGKAIKINGKKKK
jgi:hypothetical protein